jgi:eukaryotic-like serine/threonine-protein kinase
MSGHTTGLQVGQPAPAFDLSCTRPFQGHPGRFDVSEHRGRWVAVVFYPRDFTFICPTELIAISAEIDEFEKRDCDVVGVSVDPVDFHEEWIDTAPSDGGVGPLRFPLASDVGGEIARRFGVYLESERVATRGLFIIDPHGLLQYQVVHPVAVGRGAEEPLRVLDALRKGGLCGSSWKLGDGTLDPGKMLRKGTILGHYRIHETLGDGTFARVFRANDLWLERDVALKVLRPESPADVDAVLREARAAAALNHPNVCTVYSVEKPDSLPVIVMELLEGKTLSQWMREERYSLAEAYRIAGALASALATCHRADLVHGDLKPANVILTAAGDPKILDFGVARFRGQEVLPEPVSGDPDGSQAPQRAEFVHGTPWYMAPERFYGQPSTAAADVFAFGAMLFQMITGDLPFPGESIEDIREAVLDVDHARLPRRVPERFVRPIVSALAGDPRKRGDMESIAAMFA